MVKKVEKKNYFFGSNKLKFRWKKKKNIFGKNIWNLVEIKNFFFVKKVEKKNYFFWFKQIEISLKKKKNLFGKNIWNLVE